MTQRDLDRAVAHATGETVGTIRDLGFHLLGEPAMETEESDYPIQPMVLDFDVERAVRLVDLVG